MMDGEHLALAFCLGLTLFLGVCALFACRDEPLDEFGSDTPYGDVIALPSDFESRFHAERDNR